MGVKHGRDYEGILTDLTEAIGRIPDRYVFFEMDEEEWSRLAVTEQLEVDEALAEDLFYALGEEAVIPVGSGVVIHDKDQHRIHILIGEEELTFVPLIQYAHIRYLAWKTELENLPKALWLVDLAPFVLLEFEACPW